MIAAAPENFITYVQRLMTVGRPSPRRSRASGSTSGSPRPRSRSPHRRHRFFVASRDHNHELFDIDDFMTTFLSNRPPPVSQQRLLEIPILAITQEQTNLQCSICFDEFLLEEESVRKLPCNHPFHVSRKTFICSAIKILLLPSKRLTCSSTLIVSGEMHLPMAPHQRNVPSMPCQNQSQRTGRGRDRQKRSRSARQP